MKYFKRNFVFIVYISKLFSMYATRNSQILANRHNNIKKKKFTWAMVTILDNLIKHMSKKLNGLQKIDFAW